MTANAVYWTEQMRSMDDGAAREEPLEKRPWHYTSHNDRLVAVTQRGQALNHHVEVVAMEIIEEYRDL